MRKRGLVLGALLVLGLLLLGTFPIGNGTTAPPGPTGSSHLSPAVGGPTGPYISNSYVAACNGVTTCHITNVVVPTHAMLIVEVVSYATGIYSVAVHGLSTSSATAFTYTVGIYPFFFAIPAAATYTVYANVTSAGYYVELVDVVANSASISGSSQLGEGTNTHVTTNTQTTAVLYDFVMETVAVRGNQATFSVTGPQTLIANGSTATNVVWAGTMGYAYPYLGPYAGTASWTTSVIYLTSGFVIDPYGLTPSTPTGLACSVNMNYVTMTWVQPTPVWYAAAGTIMWSPVASFSPYSFAATLPNSTAATVAFSAANNLFVGTVAYFKVFATNGTAGSAASTIVKCALIAAPSNLAATAAGVGRIALVWAQAIPTPYVVNDTLGYGTTPNNYTTLVSEGVTNHTTVSGLPSNTTYYFVVWAWIAYPDESGSSNVAVTTTASLAPPILLPPILSVAGEFGGVVAAWSAAVNVTIANYTLEYGTVVGAYGTHLSEGATTFTATVTGLAQNATYYFRVQTWTGATTNGPTSNVAPAHTFSLIVRYVNTTVYHNTTTYVNTSVYHSTTTYVNTSVYHNTTTYVNTTVHQVFYANTTTYHNTTVTLSVVLPPIVDASAVSDTEITVSWSAVPGAVNYTLMYARFPWLPIAYVSVGTATVYNVTSLGFGLTYYFTVWAWNLTAEGSPSNVAPAQTDVPIPPATPFPWATLEAVTTLSVLGSLAVSAAIAVWVSGRRGRRAQRTATASLALTLARERQTGGERYPAGRAPAPPSRSYSALDRRVGRR